MFQQPAGSSPSSSGSWCTCFCLRPVLDLQSIQPASAPHRGRALGRRRGLIRFGLKGDGIRSHLAPLTHRAFSWHCNTTYLYPLICKFCRDRRNGGQLTYRVQHHERRGVCSSKPFGFRRLCPMASLGDGPAPRIHEITRNTLVDLAAVRGTSRLVVQSAPSVKHSPPLSESQALSRGRSGFHSSAPHSS